MSDKLRNAGLVKLKTVEAPKPPEAAVVPLARVTPTPPEPIAKKDREIELDSYLKLRITQKEGKVRIRVCTGDAILPLVVSADGSEVLRSELEISENQKAQLYVLAKGKLNKVEINTAGEVSAELKPCEEIKVGKVREVAYGQDVDQKAIVLESEERLVYVKETGVIIVFKEAYKFAVHEAKDAQWTKNIGRCKVWYDPSVPDYILTIGHVEELAKVREVNGPEIEFSVSEAHFGATSGAMNFEFANERIRVGVEVDPSRELTPRTKQRAKKQGIELVGSGTIRVEKIVGREATTDQGNGESWIYEPENKIEILRSKTGLIVVVNKETQKASIVVTNTADPLKAEYLKDEKTDSPVTGRSGRSTFDKDGKTYELNLMNGSVMLTQVKAPQPAPRADASVAAISPAAGPGPAARGEPKVVVSGTSATAPAPKGAERAGPGTKTLVMGQVKDPRKVIEADDEEPKPERSSNTRNRVAVLVGGVLLAFGATFFGVRSLLTKPAGPNPQTAADSAVVIAPPPTPNIPAPPPVIAPPPITTPPPIVAPPVVAADSGVVTVRDATADTTPVRRRRRIPTSSGFGNFEGM